MERSCEFSRENCVLIEDPSILPPCWKHLTSGVKKI